jgi:hypothetical protein
VRLCRLRQEGLRRFDRATPDSRLTLVVGGHRPDYHVGVERDHLRRRGVHRLATLDVGDCPPLTELPAFVPRLAAGDRRLGRRARRAADRALPAGVLAVSAISFREIAMQMRRGRIALRKSLAATAGVHGARC